MTNKNEFKMYVSSPVEDSMCYDSGEVICSYGTEEQFIQVVVRGDVRVYYKDGCYRHFTDMPEELQKKFLDGTAYVEPDKVITDNNNWHEVEYFNNGEYVDGDVLDLGTPITKEELETTCKEVLQEYIQWEAERELQTSMPTVQVEDKR